MRSQRRLPRWAESAALKLHLLAPAKPPTVGGRAYIPINIRAEGGSMSPSGDNRRKSAYDDTFERQIAADVRGAQDDLRRSIDRQMFLGKPDISFLPELDENLEPRYTPAYTLANYDSMIKEIWDSQTLLNQFYDDRNSLMSMIYGGQPSPSWEERQTARAWEDALAWISSKHRPAAPEAPMALEIAWDWPSRQVSQSPQPVGVGDLEDDLDDDDWDD